jgi:alpha- and gamma-adaptin-binding protein p34
LTESKDDEFNYDLEYEVLSHGFDNQWKFVGETSTSRRFERSNKDDGAQNHTHQVVKASIDSSTSNPLPSNTPIETTEENTVTRSNKNYNYDHADTTTVYSIEDHQSDLLEANHLFEDEHYGLEDYYLCYFFSTKCSSLVLVAPVFWSYYV